MILIPALLALVTQVAPALVSFLAGPKAEEVASRIVAATTVVTAGVASTQDSAVAALRADPALLAQLQLQLAQIALEASKLQATEDAQQTQINLAAATSPSLFVAGARPAFLWLGVILLWWSMMGQPIASAVLTIIMPRLILPSVDTAQLWPLISGMLGLGYLRSRDKQAGVETTRIAGPFSRTRP